MTLSHMNYESFYVYSDHAIAPTDTGQYKRNRDDKTEIWRRGSHPLDFGPIETLIEEIDSFSDEYSHVEITYDNLEDGGEIYLTGWRPITPTELDSINNRDKIIAKASVTYKLTGAKKAALALYDSELITYQQYANILDLIMTQEDNLLAEIELVNSL